nr:uncharacterized protein LOC118972337 [Manis javanica]
MFFRLITGRARSPSPAAGRTPGKGSGQEGSSKSLPKPAASQRRRQRPEMQATASISGQTVPGPSLVRPAAVLPLPHSRLALTSYPASAVGSEPGWRRAEPPHFPSTQPRKQNSYGTPDTRMGQQPPPRRLGCACGDKDGGRSAGKQQKGQRLDHREPRPPGGATPTALRSLRVSGRLLRGLSATLIRLRTAEKLWVRFQPVQLVVVQESEPARSRSQSHSRRRHQRKSTRHLWSLLARAS